MKSMRIGLVLFVHLGILLPPARAETPTTAPDRAALSKDPPLFLRLAMQARKWNEPAEPARLVGPIYFVGTRGLGVYLITTSEGHILINTGMPPSGPMILDSIRKLGFKPQDVKVLLTGHAHIDHCGATAFLKKQTGAQVALVDAEVELMESGGKTDFHYGSYAEFRFEPAKVDRVLRDRDQVKLGDVAITALLTPGHTKGSTTFVTNVVDHGKLYTVVFPNGTSVNPGYRLVRDPSYPGICDDFRRTLHTLEMLKPDVWFDPHTDQFDYEGKLARSAAGEAAAAWVDPEGYRKSIAARRANLEKAIDSELAAGIGAERPELLKPDGAKPK